MATIISTTTTMNIAATAKSGASSLDALLQEAVQSSGSATSASSVSGTPSTTDSSTPSTTDSGISISTADTASIQATAKSGASSLDALLQEAVQSSGSATSASSVSGTPSTTDSGISISTADTASIQATAKSGK